MFLDKNRHHTALFIQNNYLKLLIRKGPILLSNDESFYASEWIWKIEQINDDQWHSYKLFINYPDKVFCFFLFSFTIFYLFSFLRLIYILMINYLQQIMKILKLLKMLHYQLLKKLKILFLVWVLVGMVS